MFCFSNRTNPLLSLDLSRCDDMVDLGYTMVYFLLGSLQWKGLKGEGTKDYDTIKGRMFATSTEDLCRDIPKEFAIYFEDTYSLGPNDKPKYDNFRKMFRDLNSKEGSKEGSKKDDYDWDILAKGNQSSTSTNDGISSLQPTQQDPVPSSLEENMVAPSLE